MGARVRVYELARELGLTNNELIELLIKEGIDAKSHSSSIDEEYADLVRDHVLAERRSKNKELEREMAEAEDDVSEEEEADIDEETGLPELHIKPPVVVRDLAEKLEMKPNGLIAELFTMNIFATINQALDDGSVSKICENHGFKYIKEKRAKAKAKQRKSAAVKPAEPSSENDKTERAPVVTFLGHVDHGKTSLQDAVRKTQVTEGEAGGITQHIGASTIVHQGRKITFLDTPGHEAFTAMRARGAHATDIAVIVVAADDGVMPQTIEAINHAQAAGCPIIIALNKMDVPGANPDKVLVELQQNNVHVEDWGGEIGMVRVSAITGEGLDELLERIHLEAEMMELRCNPDAPGRGVILEAELEQGMGPTASLLIRNGSLKVGDVVLCGQFYGKVKALIDDKGKRLKKAGASDAVKLLGLSGVPDAGAELISGISEREAKNIASDARHDIRTDQLSVNRNATLEDLFQQIKEDAMIELKIILKADVRGSIEAITDSFNKIKSEKIRLNIIHSGVGEISENDVLLAAASDAILVGFHVRVMPAVNRVAKQEGVEIRLYTIIYELLEQIEGYMRGKLNPETEEREIGKARILQVFRITKTGKVCGCVVDEGAVRVGAHARVFRENELIYKGAIKSLRRFQDDVKEVKAGMECGIKLDNFEDFEVEDRIEIFEVDKKEAQL